MIKNTYFQIRFFPINENMKNFIFTRILPNHSLSIKLFYIFMQEVIIFLKMSPKKAFLFSLLSILEDLFRKCVKLIEIMLIKIK